MEELTAVERAIAALEEQRSALGDAVVDTALQPLTEKRDRLRSVPAAEQRKLVTVLFADVVDFTVLSGRLDPEDMREIMNDYFAAWRVAIEAEGGVVEKYIGDAVVAVFGLGRANEDDPHRAVRSALAVRAALEELNDSLEDRFGIELAVRVGIDTGEVVIGTLGERGDGDLVVVGDRVNRAARIQAAAPPGGILVSADTGRHIRGAFELHLVAGLSLKGFDEPVDGFLVVSGEVQGFWLETRGVEGITTSTIGRGLELGQLEKLFADVASDRSPLVVTVLGDAGIGKTRLIRDFESHLAGLADGVWLLRGRAAPSTEQMAAYTLLRSVFVERLGIHDSDDPDTVAEKWRSGLGQYAGTGDDGARAIETLATWLGFSIGEGARVANLRNDPEALQRRARKVMDELLRRLSDRAPVVVLLEDLHWADAASLDWLEQFAPRDIPLLVVASSRPALLERRPHWGEGLDHHTSIRLGRLSKRESRQLVDEILARVEAVPDDVTTLLVDGAEGNPFFIEELVKWLLDSRVLEADGDRWAMTGVPVGALEVPGTLRGVLQARLDALERDHRNVIDRAAVVGRVFWDDAVEELGAGADPSPDGAYDRLREHEVVFQRPTSAFEGSHEYSFRHSLMRDVAYESVLRSARRRYHARAASWLERVIAVSNRPDEHAATIAAHYEEAADESSAARWYLRAGRHAASTFANEDASRLLEAAHRLAQAAEPELRFDVLMELEAVLDRRGEREAQRKVLDEMGAIAGIDDVRRARLLLCEGNWRFFHSEFSAAAGFVDEAAVLARGANDVDLEMEALALGAKSLGFHAAHEQSRAMANELVAMARAAGNDRMVGDGLRLLAVVATNLGETRQAVALLDEARTALRRAGDVEGEALVVGQLGAAYIQMGGHLDEARRAIEEAMGMFEAIGHRLRQGIVQGNLVALAIEQGHLDEALRRGIENLELASEVEDIEGMVAARSRLGDVRCQIGDYAAAREDLEAAVTTGREYEMSYFVAFSLCGLAGVALGEGDPASAWRYAEQAEEEAAAAESRHAMTSSAHLAGRALHALGRLDAAIDRYRLAADGLREIERPVEAGWVEANRAAALLDSGQTENASLLAETVLSAALEGTLEFPETATGLLDLYRVLAAVGHQAAGDVVAAAARYLAERSDLIADASIRERFLATPVNRTLADIAATVD